MSKEVKNELAQIKRKKCFPNKRVDDLFWENSKNITSSKSIISVSGQELDRGDIYELFLNAFEEGYKKGFASGSTYWSEKELYQELSEEFDQMIKNDTYEEIFEDQKFEDRKREIK
tara:strand:+ start:2043 stop:2390 length:348 start_codon:yes stop_codon:yes gene_type:complete